MYKVALNQIKDVLILMKAGLGEDGPSLDPQTTSGAEPPDTRTSVPTTHAEPRPPRRKDSDAAYGQKQKGNAKGPIGLEPQNSERQDAAYIDAATSGLLHESTSNE